MESIVYENGEKLSRPVLEVYLLGRLEYEQALRLQNRLLYDVSGSDGRLAALIVCEHHPIISVGRLGSRAHIACDDDELAARRLAVRWVNRGGGCVLHAPGQLAAYPIFPVPVGAVLLHHYVLGLERCLLKVLDEFLIQGQPRPDHTAIWTRRGQIATIGVAVTRWVAYHGLTLNVTGWIEPYRIVHPEGNGAVCVTTMEAERKRHIAMSKVREALVRWFVQSFGLERYHLYTHHPMLTSGERRHAFAGSLAS